MTRDALPQLLGIWLAVGLVSFIALFRVSAPYGRYLRRGWGPTIPRTLGWVLMELPAAVLPVAFFLSSDRRGDLVPVAFLALWLSHYVNRSLIFPFRMRGGEQRMPLTIAAMAFFFNLVNGALQGWYLFSAGPARDVSWLLDPRFLVGLALFGGGYGLNLHSDAILRRLRAPGDSGYHIPHSGWFRFVSCPNYLGEIIEWGGWALLTWSPTGLVFFLWTVANLAPRARSHHRWYLEKFPDYPADRRALIPHLF
jgi:protein-S-isoprenylcysteine O-methyltransferase Ste14